MSRSLDEKATDYQWVLASATSSAIGRGVAGTYIKRLTIIPLSLTPGSVTLQDGSETVRTLFIGGTGVAGVNREFRPVRLDLGRLSRNGAWKVSTGADVIALVTGKF